jgi:hypothetical protein
MGRDQDALRAQAAAEPRRRQDADPRVQHSTNPSDRTVARATGPQVAIPLGGAEGAHSQRVVIPERPPRTGVGTRTRRDPPPQSSPCRPTPRRLAPHPPHLLGSGTPRSPRLADNAERTAGHSDRGPLGGSVHTPPTTTNPPLLPVAARSHAVRDPPGARNRTYRLDLYMPWSGARVGCWNLSQVPPQHIRRVKWWQV